MPVLIGIWKSRSKMLTGVSDFDWDKSILSMLFLTSLSTQSITCWPFTQNIVWSMTRSLRVCCFRISMLMCWSSATTMSPSSWTTFSNSIFSGDSHFVNYSSRLSLLRSSGDSWLATSLSSIVCIKFFFNELFDLNFIFVDNLFSLILAVSTMISSV